AKAQQSTAQSPASETQKLQSPAEVGSAPEKGPEAAAKDAAENPVAAAISLPLQNNTFYGVGPYRRAENELLIEPVVPIRLSENWMLISRTIVPVVVVPRLTANAGVDYGLSNIQPQFYLSPVHTGKFVWGVGPQLWLPTATDDKLGINKWGGGPAVVGLIRSGHLLAGTLIGNEFAGVNHVHENQMTINWFAFYNMKRGWYVLTTPIVTADWTAERDKRWTVPVGGGAGRIFKIGHQPLNARAEFFNDVRTTAGGTDWQMQTQLQFLFIHHK
ncbi:MAG: neuromedin U, partial [Terracidiphilus sp.]